MLLVQAKCVRTNVVRALADVVATKLGIILFCSFHLLFSQKGFAYDFEIVHAFLSSQKKIEGRTPPSPPKLSFLGEQQACAMGNKL